MDISPKMVKELRDKTGVGMMDCRKALQESDGDIERAVLYLREKGFEAASKKARRESKEGKVFICINEDGTKAAILELSCETDFVAKNTDFDDLGNQLLAILIGHDHIQSLEELNEVKKDGKPIKEVLSEAVLKLGENVNVKQFRILTAGSAHSYVHSNGKIGVVTAFNQPVDPVLGRDVSMHIAASHPIYISPEDIPDSEIQKETEVIQAQLKNEGKPDHILDQITKGKLSKYYKDVCLLEQPFVKDPDKQIKCVLPKGTAVTEFLRYALV